MEQGLSPLRRWVDDEWGVRLIVSQHWLRVHCRQGRARQDRGRPLVCGILAGALLVEFAWRRRQGAWWAAVMVMMMNGDGGR
jgi:hypothetical protein